MFQLIASLINIAKLNAIFVLILFHFQSIFQESKCPVCLGTDLCEDISSGFLSLTSLERVSLSTSSLYSGNIGVEHPVFLQVIGLAICARNDVLPSPYF